MSTYDDASLIYYPSGVKAGKAYSLKPTDGSGDLTFTRASTATRVNESGLIEEVASGVPRIDYTGGGCAKLLLEPQRTNLITYSEQLNLWSGSNVTITSNTSQSPDGYENADNVNITATNGYWRRSSLTFANSTSYAASVFVKKSATTGTKTFKLYYNNNAGSPNNATWTCVVDLTNITATTTVGGTAVTGAPTILSTKLVDYGNDWYRVEVSFTTGSGAGNSASEIGFQANGVVVDFNAWGAQVEQGSFATSYIPTTTTAVTRVKDFGTTDVFGSTFTLSGDFVLFSDIKLKEIIFNVLWSGGNYSIGADYRSYCIFSSTTLLRLFGVGEVVVADLSAVTFVADTHYKIAIRRESGVVNFFVNGTKYSSSGGTPSTTIKIRSISGANLGGKNSYDLNSAFINENTMSDAELLTLTTL